MNNRTFNKVRHAGRGKGGYKCRCCGPSPSGRKGYNRRTRRILKQCDRIENIRPDES